MRRSRLSIIGVTLATALAMSLSLTPAAEAGTPSPATFGSAAPAYYLSLGDSLAFGYSTANYASWVTAGSPTDFRPYFHGYTDDLAGWLGVPAVNLSCPGETSADMINSGCESPPSSTPQLAAAVDYLTPHRWQRGVITLSIGADDVLPLAGTCLAVTTCTGLQAALQTLRSNLSTILSTLRRAAPFATIVVLAPYNPFGFAYPASNLLAVQVDLSIAAVSLLHFDRVADAFVPLNITLAATHCTYVYYGCSQYGQYAYDIHPTSAGYAVIAKAFEKSLG